MYSLRVLIFDGFGVDLAIGLLPFLFIFQFLEAIMIVKLCSIASGSSGNCIYLGSDRTGFLVDGGISRKAILENLKNLGVLTESIKALFVTHEHSDHIKSIGALSRKLDIPIYANAKTWEAMEASLGNIKSENIKIFETGTEFQIEDVNIKQIGRAHV